MDEPNIGVEAVSQHRAGHERDDFGELAGVGGAALGVEGVVLDQVFGDVGVEGADDVFLDVEGVDEGGEDLALHGFGGVAWWAVGFGDVGAGGELGGGGGAL